MTAVAFDSSGSGSQSGDSGRRNRRKLALYGLALFLAAAAVYLSTVGYDYTLMDDYGLIVENREFISSPTTLFRAFALDPYGSPGVMYRPVLTLSLMLDHAWSGASPGGYHLTNVLIHAGCSLLLFLLLTMLGGGPRPSLALAALFASHPVLVPAVAWIPGRNDTLMAAWLMASLIAWLRYASGTGRMWLLLHWLFGGLALFTKETALLLPLLWAALAWRQRRDTGPKRLAIAAMGWAVLLILWAVLRSRAMSGGAGPRMIGAADLTRGFLGYAGKIILPVRLAAIPLPDNMGLWLGAAALAVLVGLVMVGGLRSKFLFGFGLAWFLLALAPNAATSTDYPNFLEHRAYLPMIGLSVLALGINPFPLAVRHRRLAVAFISIVLAGLAAASLHRSGHYRNRHSFWDYAVKTSPRLYYVHDMQGKVRLQDGDHAGARASFEQTLRLNPGYHHGYNNLAVALAMMGEAGPATQALEKALSLMPENVESLMNLGTLKRQGGDPAGAAALYRRALLADPLNHQAWNDLGTVLFGLERPQEALECLGRALELDPGNLSYQGNYRTVRIKLSAVATDKIKK